MGRPMNWVNQFVSLTHYTHAHSIYCRAANIPWPSSGPESFASERILATAIVHMQLHFELTIAASNIIHIYGPLLMPALSI